MSATSRSRFVSEPPPAYTLDDLSFSVEKVLHDTSRSKTASELNDLPGHISKNARKFLSSLISEYTEQIPVIELRYTIKGVALAQVLTAFKLMVFDESDKMPTAFEKERKMSKRQELSNKCASLSTISKDGSLPVSSSSSSSDTTTKVDSVSDTAEEWKFEVVLLPLLESDHSEESKTSDDSGSTTKTTGDDASMWDSAWSAVSSFGTWAVTAASDSVNSVARMLNMLLTAQETWRIVRSEKVAMCLVQNETMRSVAAVDEWSQIYERKIEVSEESEGARNSTEVVFVKRLYMNALVSPPQMMIDQMSEKYIEDSNYQFTIVLQIIKDPSIARVG